jgi:soluble lytic murein transglycosylase-like protein
MLMVTLVFMSVVSFASFAFRFHSFDVSDAKMSQLERRVANLRAAMNIDAMRQYNVQKIMGIIDRYNPTMSSGEKYDIADEIHRMCIKYSNLNVDLICATITHETAMTWRPEVKSPAGAIGLMQVMPATGLFLSMYEGITWTGPDEVLCNPIYNIRLGCRYLSTLISMYDLEGGLAAYNGGERRAALWLASGRNDQILWEETRGYVPAVLQLYDQFQN